MAEQNLSSPYVGYRSAGRRPEQQNDRVAADHAPLSAIRGLSSIEDIKNMQDMLTDRVKPEPGFAAGGYVDYDPHHVDYLADNVRRGFAEGGMVEADESKAAFGIYPKQRATPSSKETKAAAAEAAQFAADMLIPQTPMDAGLMLIPSAGIARKAGAALIALDAGDVEASPLTKLLKAVRGSVKDPEVVKDTIKEHKMLQGVYRGYAGENVPAKTAFGTETYFISPQKRVADYYAQRRAAETGTTPHAEMMLIDPAALRNQPYNLSIPIDKYNRDFLVTRARRVDLDEAKSRTQLYAAGGLVNTETNPYDETKIHGIMASLHKEMTNGY